MSPVLSAEAMILLSEYHFWRGVEWAVGYTMSDDERAAACVCAFLWWGAM